MFKVNWSLLFALLALVPSDSESSRLNAIWRSPHLSRKLPLPIPNHRVTTQLHSERLGETRLYLPIAKFVTKVRRNAEEDLAKPAYASAFESLTEFQLFYCSLLKTSFLYSQNNLATTCLFQTHVFGSSVSSFLQV